MNSHPLLMTLACIATGSLAAAWLRQLLDWGSLSRLANGTRVKLLFEKKSKKLRRVVVGVPVATTLAFELTPETTTDVWFKQAGWTIEQQVGDVHFDAALFDDRRHFRQLRISAACLDDFGRNRLGTWVDAVVARRSSPLGHYEHLCIPVFAPCLDQPLKLVTRYPDRASEANGILAGRRRQAQILVYGG